MREVLPENRSAVQRPARERVSVADKIDVAAIRKRSRGGLGATQESFACAIGVPVKTLRNWEQGRRQPTGPARVLLAMIAREPRIVSEVMNGQRRNDTPKQNYASGEVITNSARC